MQRSSYCKSSRRSPKFEGACLRVLDFIRLFYAYLILLHLSKPFKSCHDINPLFNLFVVRTLIISVDSGWYSEMVLLVSYEAATKSLGVNVTMDFVHAWKVTSIRSV